MIILTIRITELDTPEVSQLISVSAVVAVVWAHVFWYTALYFGY